MPRLLSRNPAYRKHRPSGQTRVRIEGRDIYLGPFGTKVSRAEYDRVVAEWLAAGRRLNHGTRSDLTVTELIDRFWVHIQSYYRKPDGSPTTEVANFKPPLAILRRLYGSTLAAAFGPLALDALRGEMIRAGWCRKLINQHAARIKMVFKWAVAKELVPPNVHHGLLAVAGLRAGRSEARESEPVRPVDAAVVDATLPHLSSVVAAMVQVQRLTGARPAEICNMKTEEIDMAGSEWIYKPSSHKTQHHGHERTIFIGPKCQQILRPFLKPLNPTAFIFSPKDADAERRQRLSAERTTPMSCGNVPGSNRIRNPKRSPGDSYDVAAYRRAIARACEVAGVESWHPHQLRHTAATEIRRQFGIEAAQCILGHATLKITEVYAERNSEAGRRIAAAIG